MINLKKVRKNFTRFADDLNSIIPGIVEYHANIGSILEKDGKLYFKDEQTPMLVIKSIVDYFKQEVGVDINIVNVIGQILSANILLPEKYNNEEKKDNGNGKTGNNKKTKTK